jgi:uncharacterized protein YkwD
LRKAASAPAALLVVALVLGGLVVLAFVLPPFQNYAGLGPASSNQPPSSVTSTFSRSSSEPSSSVVSTSAGPVISNGSLTLTYPSNYASLANYTLNLINNDRDKFGLSSVTLSPIISAQQHADSMLYFGYFSHWDTQDYKPYVRYSLLNGTGAVEENVAYEYTNLPSFGSTQDVEQSISKLEYQMIYNDSACCQNGHRENILNALHNRVSLGIAYNSTRVFLVEDFENYYLELQQPFLSQNNTVYLSGNSTYPLDGVEVLVFYDNYPQPLTSGDLATSSYRGSYDQGTFLGGVVPLCIFSCLSYPGGITVTATKWRVTSNSIQVQFQLGAFVQADGSGIYTVYLENPGQSNPEILFDASFIIG